MKNDEISALVGKIRHLAKQYYQLTGRPLGATSELGERAVAELMNLELAQVRQEGYDAVKPDGTRVQIKARAVPNPNKVNGLVGAINIEKDWDTVMLVLMSNRDYEPSAIFEAQRAAIEHAVTRVPEAGDAMRTEGKARKSGKLSIVEFQRISKKVWSPSTQLPHRPVQPLKREGKHAVGEDLLDDL